MAITLYATMNYVGNGTTVNWNINFADGYLETSDVKARYFTPTGDSVNIPITSIATNTVTISPAVISGRAFQIYRDTEKSFPLVNYSDGSILNETNLDTTTRQAIMVSAEASDLASTIQSSSIQALTTANTALTQSAAAQTAATSAQASASSAQSSASAAQTAAGNAQSSAAAAQTAANGAVSTANTANSNASAALTAANTASTNATTALNTANSASANATTAISTANSASAAASGATTTANNAANTASTALTAANSATSTANDASNTANGIAGTANTALTNSQNAINTANSAESTANGIAGTANTALANSNTAISTANSASATANAIDGKATQAQADAAAAVTAANNAQNAAQAAVPRVATPYNVNNLTNGFSVSHNTGGVLLNVTATGVQVGTTAAPAALPAGSTVGGVAIGTGSAADVWTGSEITAVWGKDNGTGATTALSAGSVVSVSKVGRLVTIQFQVTATAAVSGGFDRIGLRITPVANVSKFPTLAKAPASAIVARCYDNQSGTFNTASFQYVTDGTLWIGFGQSGNSGGQPALQNNISASSVISGIITYVEAP